MARDIVQELIALVIRELNVNPAAIGPATPLFEGGLELDSFAVVDLVTRIEAHFDIQLTDADFQPENFANFQILGTVVQGYVPAA